MIAADIKEDWPHARQCYKCIYLLPGQSYDLDTIAIVILLMGNWGRDSRKFAQVT